MSRLLWLGIGLAAVGGLVSLVLAQAELSKRVRRQGVTAAVFLFPALLFIAVGLIYPASRTLILSFYDRDGDNPVGWDNFTWVVTDPDTQHMLINTAMWIIIVPMTATFIGLVYAALIDGKRGERVYKMLVFLPMSISFVGASVIWAFIYDVRPPQENQIGILNAMVTAFGGEPVDWLRDWPVNTLLLIAILVWIQVGFATVLLSAALKAVPSEINEAARMDGASRWQLFWRITVPSVKPAIVLVMITIFIATLKLFDIVRTMTGGRRGTDVIAHNMWAQIYEQRHIGRGSAMAVLLLVLVVPVIVYQVRNLRRYQREGR
ncbi:carbohydrate ABC transporter permease [Haloglycomyces albus]|uniref:carbohydrate ABC transporter permease n=1 Tax=Haloglycomyces albus TaxID=526067 RepID=UPI00046D717E|nr:sugar ABC transporter permease [Haloglycomyces albus]